MGTPVPKIVLLRAFSTGYNMHKKIPPASPSLVFKMDRLTGMADRTTDIDSDRILHRFWTDEPKTLNFCTGKTVRGIYWIYLPIPLTTA